MKPEFCFIVIISIFIQKSVNHETRFKIKLKKMDIVGLGIICKYSYK